ncbi:hypothetical protein Dda_2544 [Drechslerella dactyloides]|uniref:Uncharacterized protein n=1 Tax=Drechslerella dactyloides TaxID=74499 RepID=A0AAD6NKV3_DREDA|nr:hypothetical protein Dda_2544 [Drechslerella dactyloides]
MEYLEGYLPSPPPKKYNLALPQNIRPFFYIFILDKVAHLRLTNSAPDKPIQSYEFNVGKYKPRRKEIPKILGWKLHDESAKVWSTLEQDIIGNDRLRFGYPAGDNCWFKDLGYDWHNDINSEDPVWAVRGYMLEPEKQTERGWPSPYVVILCSEEVVSKKAYKEVKRIVHEANPKNNHYGHWGVTRLPKIEVLELGDEDDDSDTEMGWLSGVNSGDDELEIIEVEMSSEIYPFMANGPLPSWNSMQRHRCGIRLEVKLEPNSRTTTSGTLGGIVSVDNKLYGLTVGHIFRPREDNYDDDDDGNDGNDYDNDDDDDGIDGNDKIEEDIDQDDKEYNESDRGKTEADDGDVEIENYDDNINEVGTGINEEESGNSSQGLRAEGRHYNMSLDWALVDLPDLGEDASTWDDLNLVQTTSGDFRPMLVIAEEPAFGRMVVLATPSSTYGLRGFFIGSEAIIKIPAYSVPYAVWVLRMESPWLIQKGDCGSWAFDAFTGSLLGILVAGCPDLLEAYILPAFRVFSDIEEQLRLPVRLPNGYSVSDNDQSKIQEIFCSQKTLMQKSTTAGPWNWKDLESEIDLWASESTKIVKDSKSQQRLNSDWTIPILLHAARHEWLWHTNSLPSEVKKVCNECRIISVDLPKISSKQDLLLRAAKAAVRQRPIHCYDSMNAMWRNLPSAWDLKQSFRGKPFQRMIQDTNRQLEQRVIMNTVWDHLILNKNKLPTRNKRIREHSNEEKSAVIQKAWGYQDLDVAERLSDHSPWDRYTFTDVIKLLKEDLVNEVRLARLGFAREFWGVDVDIKQGVDSTLLFGAFVVNEERSQILIIVSPNRVGFKNACLPEFHLPLALWEDGQDEEANLVRLFRDQLNLTEITWKEKTKLTWEPDLSSCSVPHIRVDLYEIVLAEKDWQTSTVNKANRSVLAMDIKKVEILFPQRFRRVLKDQYPFAYPDPSSSHLVEEWFLS